jgi:hypothetical protein
MLVGMSSGSVVMKMSTVAKMLTFTVSSKIENNKNRGLFFFVALLLPKYSYSPLCLRTKKRNAGRSERKERNKEKKQKKKKKEKRKIEPNERKKSPTEGEKTISSPANEGRVHVQDTVLGAQSSRLSKKRLIR